MVGGNRRTWAGRIEAEAEVGAGAGPAAGPGPRVASDEASGVFRVVDPRVFRADGRAFCRAWLLAAVRHLGVRKAGVDLATATALIEFEPGSTPTAAMAAAFAVAVRQALAGPSPPAGGRSDWVALLAFAGQDHLPWEVSRRSSNRLHLRPPGGALRGGWAGRVAVSGGVIGCRTAWLSDALIVAFDPTLTNEGLILEALRRARLESARAGLVPAADPRGRALNLAKAGGSFALTLVGIAVPGIPTLPFLLGTSYYLARSSPGLNEALLGSPVFGEVLREWERHHGLGPASKAKLLGLSALILSVSLALAAPSPVALVPVLLMSLASLYATLRIPGLPAVEGEGLGRSSAPHPALG